MSRIKTNNFDEKYVNVTGDTMTGTLTLPQIIVGTGTITAPVGNFALVTASPTITRDTNGNVFFSDSEFTVNGSGNTAIYGQFIYPSYTGTSTTVGMSGQDVELNFGNGVDVCGDINVTTLVGAFYSTSIYANAVANGNYNIWIAEPTVANANQLTNNYGLLIANQGGHSVNAGYNILSEGTGLNVFQGRVEKGKGVNVASGNNLALGLDGNLFHITGVTQI